MLFSPICVDDDQGDTGRLDRVDQEALDIDALGRQRRPRIGPESVIPDRADEEGPGAEPRGRDRLVATLPP